MVLIDKEYIQRNFTVPSSYYLKTEPFHSKEPEKDCCIESSESEEGNLAWKKLLALLSVRDRSIAECKRKLSEASFSEDAIGHAIKRAQRCHLLNDARFADSFIRAKLNAGKGLKGITFSLSEHGISSSNLVGFPEEYLGGVTEYDRACSFIASHPSRSKNLWNGAFNKLIRAGYDQDSAYRAASWYSQQVKNKND